MSHSLTSPGGPAIRLADFAKELGKCKLKPFFLYRNLKDLSEMLEKYEIISKDITCISQFISCK
jgi:hypothetical protein